MKNTVAIIIPARLASTRLPGKLLLNRTGRTVLEHTVDCARKAQEDSSGLITAVIVACDDAALMEAAERGGAKAVLTSPDHASGTDRIAEAAASLDEEIIVNVQADEPELAVEAILKVAQLQVDASADAPMSTLAVPIKERALWESPSVVKTVLDGSGNALYFSRAPIPFPRDGSARMGSPLDLANGNSETIFGLQHLGLYAYRKDFLLGYKNLPPSELEKIECLEQLRALEAGYRIQVGVIASSPPGIDTPEEYDAFVQRWHAQAPFRRS